MQRAILFDMDGVLVDSEPVILKAAIQGLGEFGVSAVPADFTEFVGAGEDRFVGGVAEKHGKPYVPDMKKRVYEIYCSIVEEEIVLFEKVPETLRQLKKMGFKIAVASSADRIKVEANLKAASIPLDLPDTILTGEDVERKKPFPDIFLKAAQRLEVEPDFCLVVEDAVNGIQAAAAAGMKSIGIPSSFSKEQLLAAGASATVGQVKELPDVLIKIWE